MFLAMPKGLIFYNIILIFVNSVDKNVVAPAVKNVYTQEKNKKRFLRKHIFIYHLIKYEYNNLFPKKEKVRLWEEPYF